MKNVKKWLTNDENPQIDDLKNNHDFSSAKLIKWHGGTEINSKTQAQLLNFIQLGGTLICALTPWGHLQCNPNKKLKDVRILNFYFKYSINIIALYIAYNVSVFKQ